MAIAFRSLCGVCGVARLVDLALRRTRGKRHRDGRARAGRRTDLFYLTAVARHGLWGHIEHISFGTQTNMIH